MIRVLFALLTGMSAFAGELIVSEWRIAPANELPPVAFGDSAQKTADLLEQISLDWEGTNVWRSNPQAFGNGDVEIHSTYQRAVALAGAYLTSDSYGKAKVEVAGSRPLKVFANGKEVAKALNADSSGYKASAELTLDRARTELLVATVSQAADSGVWRFKAVIKTDSASEVAVTSGGSLRSRPARFDMEGAIHDFPSLVMSPNGKLLVVKRTVREGAEYEQRTWHEIYELDGLKLVHSTKLDGVSGIKFSSDSQRLYYKLKVDDGYELWEQTTATKASRRILKAVKDMEGYEVLPDGMGVIYAVSKEKPENKTGYDLFRELDDRPTGYNDRRELFLAQLTTGLTRQLTKAGEFDLDKWSLSPSGKRLLIIRNVPRNTRPYVTQEFWTLDLETGRLLEVDTRNLLEQPQNIIWLDEDRVAYCAGSHDAMPDDTVYHNVAQLVLYTLDLKTGETRNLTADALFSLNDEGGHARIRYDALAKSFIVHVMQGGERQFARVSLDGKKITYRPYDIPWEFTDNPAMALNGSRIAYLASDFDSPRGVYVYDVVSNKERTLLDPNQEVVSEWEFGSMERWPFTNRLGLEIEGWIYKPADFTPLKKWPLIVYYYAGVSPRDVRFSFQYQMWLANGYVVYVLNPVGSAGYGQDFADYHAGDWGTEATQDVIEGTEKVLAAHSYLDRERMGCYGGSYGGFVTLDLLTKTDMFKTAIDMYGISNITNYFGGGTWGNWYSDIASPGAYPWSDRDIYVDKSPIYNADKIKTPLLILHGGADNNVPWIESDQMFVALKLLGQDVVYARFQEESHNINSKYKNLIEHRQMMLEWFDKYLKDRPQAWDARMETWK